MKDVLANIAMVEWLDVNIHSGLGRIYRLLETELVQLNPGCNQCGMCCNFTTFDHILYASSIEINYITRNYEKYYQKIRDLREKYTIQWRYLPFLNRLAEFKSKTTAARLQSWPTSF